MGNHGMSNDVLSRSVTRREALALGAGALLLTAGGHTSKPEPAWADAADSLGSVYLESVTNGSLFYFDERINWVDGFINIGTNKRYVTLEGHRLSAFCANPALCGFGNMSMQAYDADAYVSTTAVEETRTIMWFAPGQPGFDRSIWPTDAPHRNDYHWRNPSEGIYGHPQTMSDDDYRLCVAHVVLAWALGGRSNARGAYAGLSSDTIAWYEANVCSDAPNATFGRALARADEVPSRDSYDIFLLNPNNDYPHPKHPGQASQTILCAMYQEMGEANLNKVTAHKDWV